MNRHSVAKKIGMDTIAENVGELISLLERIPKDTPLKIADADSGGYDVSLQPYIYVYNEGGFIFFGHLECEAYSAYEKKAITYDEYKVLGG